MQSPKDMSKRGLSIGTVDTPTLKEEALRHFLDNQRVTAKSMCEIMGLDYSIYGNTLRTYLWKFRCQLKYGSLQGSQNSVSWHRPVWECLEFVVLSPERENVAIACGWKVSSNRNRMLLYHGRNDGTLFWYRDGRVLMFMKRMNPLARAVEVFWQGFSFLGDKECTRLSKLIVPSKKHNVFHLGQPVPRFDIPFFQYTHGLRIKSDGTDRNCLEVEETVPPLMAKYDLLIKETLQVERLHSENIKAHLDLISKWKDEAEQARAWRQEAAGKVECESQTRRQVKLGFWTRVSCWLNSEIILLVREGAT